MARTYPRVAWLFRSRDSWMIQETVLPVLSVAAFAYAYQAMNAPPEYAGFVVLGAAMTTFWLNVLWGMGAQLYWERDSGNLELYIMSPAPMMAILTGMALGGMTTTLVRATAITVTGVLIFDVPIQPTSWWLLVAVFLLTLAALYGLGMMFASLFLLWGREAWHLVNLLQEPVYLLSGTNFPVSIFPKAVAVVASAIPLTTRHGRDAAGAVPNARHLRRVGGSDCAGGAGGGVPVRGAPVLAIPGTPREGRREADGAMAVDRETLRS